ncbi:hypothetical protein HD599_002668 [Conyzicola lurida]|uniref:Bacteriophage T5 Orf172 DNA-binding domain-containing protein n=1 Tax=Conyzicola lurida TaxID=1172621 RepID=A0A841ARZ9_9MICO|nr:hypothetical protein [Conyzicola lurida]
MNRCLIVDDAGQCCAASVAPGAPLDLCAAHLLEAHDWVAGDVGVTDILPSPCLACGSRLGLHYPSGWLCAVCEWKVGEVPDPDDALAARVDVVYYLRFGDRIKIGTSSNPRQRFAALRYDEVLAFERGDRTLEQRRHAQFAAHRLSPRSEWFGSHDALLAHIEVLRSGVDDPWSLYALWRSQRLALGAS